jgi:hypothetical protein
LPLAQSKAHPDPLDPLDRLDPPDPLDRLDPPDPLDRLDPLGLKVIRV